MDIEHDAAKHTKKEEIKGSKDYITWLEAYAKTHPSFTSDEYLFSSQMSTNDQENTENIGMLYEIIKEYATKNFILPDSDELGCYYQITYNSSFYKIGYAHGPEFFYYCKVVEPSKEKVIDFNDIMQGKSQFKADLVKLKLEKIAILTSELKIAHIPEEIVLDTVAKTYRKTKRK